MICFWLSFWFVAINCIERFIWGPFLTVENKYLIENAINIPSDYWCIVKNPSGNFIFNQKNLYGVGKKEFRLFCNYVLFTPKKNDFKKPNVYRIPKKWKDINNKIDQLMKQLPTKEL